MIIDVAIRGLLSGVSLATVALGLSLIFGMMRTINFAHGAFFMLGAFFYVELTNRGVAAPLVILGSALAAGVIAGIAYRLVLKGMGFLEQALLTIGLSAMLTEAVRNVWDNKPQPARVPDYLKGVVTFGDNVVSKYSLFAVGIGLTITIALWVAIDHTSLGMQIRAATENGITTRTLGVNTDRLLTFTYAIGAALAAVGGVLQAPLVQVDADMGSTILITSFIVVIVGGMGSILGAIIASLGLAQLNGFMAAYAPSYSAYSLYVVLIGFLLLRPGGLIGKWYLGEEDG